MNKLPSLNIALLAAAGIFLSACDSLEQRVTVELLAGELKSGSSKTELQLVESDQAQGYLQSISKFSGGLNDVEIQFDLFGVNGKTPSLTIKHKQGLKVNLPQEQAWYARSGSSQPYKVVGMRQFQLPGHAGRTASQFVFQLPESIAAIGLSGRMKLFPPLVEKLKAQQDVAHQFDLAFQVGDGTYRIETSVVLGIENYLGSIVPGVP